MSLEDPALLLDIFLSELPVTIEYEDLVFEETFMIDTSLSTEIFNLPGFLSSRCEPSFDAYTIEKTIVEQEDVLRGVTDIQGLSWASGPRGRIMHLIMRKSQGAHVRRNNHTKYPQGTQNVDYSETYYNFRYTDTSYPCSYGHFQLRNLVVMTSKNDVYYTKNNTVMQWSPQRRQSRTLLGDRYVPYRITAMAARDNLLMAAGEDGSYSLLNLDTCAMPERGSLTDDRYVEVNSIEMSISRSGAPHAYVTTNDFTVRNIDMTTLQVMATFPTEWYANYATQSPDKHMICVVGDHHDGKVFSVNSREVIATLVGHRQHTFACAWSPDSRLIATGSDDMSVILYDTRRMDEPLHIISNNIYSSVRSLRYSEDGRFLFLSEDCDGVKIIDTTTDYTKGQAIGFIGDVSGFAISPSDAESMFIGTAGEPFSSLLEFERSPSKWDEDKHDFLWI